MSKENRIWKLEDDVNTDVIAPGYAIRYGIDGLKKHTLEAVRSEFHSQVTFGDIIIAGKNMGIGSSREQAALVLKALGVKAICAESFSRIFFRNLLNFGVFAYNIPKNSTADFQSMVDGDIITLDTEKDILHNISQKKSLPLEPLPNFLKTIVINGGMMAYLKKQKNGNITFPSVD